MCLGCEVGGRTRNGSTAAAALVLAPERQACRQMLMTKYGPVLLLSMQLQLRQSRVGAAQVERAQPVQLPSLAAQL